MVIGEYKFDAIYFGHKFSIHFHQFINKSHTDAYYTCDSCLMAALVPSFLFFFLKNEKKKTHFKCIYTDAQLKTHVTWHERNPEENCSFLMRNFVCNN